MWDRRFRRSLILLSILTLAAITAFTPALTIWSVWTAKTEVPWRDQWKFLNDARQIQTHHWPSLWYAYWGHRPVIARLATLFGLTFFPTLNTPLIVLILAVQAAHAGLLVYIARRLFHPISRPVFLIAAALIIQLAFSSLQLENFLWAAQIGYVLVWAGATAAFFLLATYAEA